MVSWPIELIYKNLNDADWSTCLPFHCQQVQSMKEVIWIILIINENPGTSVSKQSYILATVR